MRGFIADPVFLALLLLVAGLLVGLRNRTLGSAVILVGALALYLLATPIVADTLYRLAQIDPKTETPSGQAGAIVVLPAGMLTGAPEYGGDTIDALSLQRVRFAARLQRLTGLPILVSGGLPYGAAITNGEALRRALVEDFGAHVEWVEESARNTEQHAVNSAAILLAQSIDAILLVTHAAHMPRARDSFERAGLSVTPAATVFTTDGKPFSLRYLIPRTRALFKSWYALHELVGRLWYRMAYD